MSQGLINSILTQTVTQILILSLPLLGVAMVVGLIISIFQATTSIQEQTLTFVPKMIAIMLILIVFGPFYLSSMRDFVMHFFDMIANAHL